MVELTNQHLRAMLHLIKERRDSVRLHGWIEGATKISLPRKVFSAGNSSPFQFVRDAFFNDGSDIAAWANRSGIKTLGASILALLAYTLRDGLQGRVLSGSLDQARNLYKYWGDWCAGPLKWRLDGDVNRLQTLVGGGKLEILAASAKTVRGPKVQLLFKDEVDEIDPELNDISQGMIASMPGMPARTIYTSTWHRASGPMGTLVEGSPGNGIPIYRWNLWESIAKCPSDRHENGRGCQNCFLGDACVAKAREFHKEPLRRLGIAAEAEGLYLVSDVLKAARTVSQSMWESEYLCDRPSVAGLVYPTFDRRVHVVRDLDFDKDLPAWRVIDWGLNWFVCLWIQEDKMGRVYVVDEMWAQDTTVADNARAIIVRDSKGFPPVRIMNTFCDPAGRSRNDQTGRSDVDVVASIFGKRPRYKTDKWSTEVKNGIGLVRAALKPALGPPRLFVAGACKMLLKAFESYVNRKVNNEWVDEPVKPQAMDHGMDALRYFFVNRHRGSSDRIGRARTT